MFKIWLSIALLLTIGFIIVFSLIDIKKLYINLKKGFEHTSKSIDSTIDATIEYGKTSVLGKLFLLTDNIILSSNIKLYIPYYNILVHFLVSSIFSLIAFLWISQYMNILISLLFSVLGFLIPFLILRIISSYLNMKIQRNAVDFLIILKNYLIATGDLITAFEKIVDSLDEPLRTYIDIFIYEYKHKISPIQCFDNLINKLENQELKLFFENLKIAHINGSDVLALIDEFTNEIYNLNEDEDKENTEDKILNLGLYLLLILNFFVIYFILNSNLSFNIVNTFTGQVVFALDILISFYIMYTTLNKEY